MLIKPIPIRLHENNKNKLSGPKILNQNTAEIGPIMDAIPPIKIIVPLADVISSGFR